MTAPLPGRGAERVELESIWHDAPIGLAVIDASLRFVRINARLAEINGAPPEAHLGRSVREMVPDLTEQGEAALRRVIETGEPLRDVEITGETPAMPGVRRTWLEQFLPLRDAAGRVVGVSVVAEEVTRQREAQAGRDRATADLRESERRLAMALEAGQLGFWDWDLHTGFVHHGGRWAAMLGHEPGEIEPRLRAWRERVHPDDIERADALLQAHLDGRTPFYECEHRLRTKSGDWIWVLDRGRVVERDDAGRPLRAIGTHHDVSDRRAAIDALYEADRRKDEFLAMLGHELRNPLAGLTTAVRVLTADTGLAPASLQAAAIARRQLQQLRRLVDDLLDVSRITRGHIELLLETVWVETALRAAVEGIRAPCEARGHTLRLEPVSPALAVRADRVRLAQILDNLLNNACKYTPSGGRITVSAHADGDRIEVRVADTGVGLAPEMLDTVFEPFTQVEPGIDLAQGGLGIGLSLVRRLAALHGGTAHARSDGPGRGSVFVLRLPRA
ncbi:MAG: ATP-binding protein [Burkholderiales bacterium]